MARIQILELPMEHHGDDTITPFVLIIDESPEYVSPDKLKASMDYIARKTGARAALCFSETIDIPANIVTVDPDGTPVRLHIEGDISKVHEQTAEVAASLQDKFRLGAT